MPFSVANERRNSRFCLVSMETCCFSSGRAPKETMQHGKVMVVGLWCGGGVVKITSSLCVQWFLY